MNFTKNAEEICFSSSMVYIIKYAVELVFSSGGKMVYIIKYAVELVFSSGGKNDEFYNALQYCQRPQG